MIKPMEQIRWWHQVPLRDGRVTPGQIPIYTLEGRYLFDTLDFQGKSILDVGCWDGYFSFMAEKRGARRVVALDNPAFRWGGQEGFLFLHDHFQSAVEWREGTVYQLPPETYDIVLCYGVLYHLSDPLAAAINCFQRSNGLVLFEGLMWEDRTPLLRLLEPGYYADDDGIRDYSNIYTMSTGYLETIGRLNGFDLVEHKQTEPFRGAVCFKAARKTASGFASTCFPVPHIT
jgi:tRNA (mo5U34)-methyltransferase